MRYITALTLVDNKPIRERVPIYTSSVYPYGEILKCDTVSDGETGYIYNIPASFDIETTTEMECGNAFAYMYHWQMCIDTHVIFGRTWNEFIEFLQKLKTILGIGTGYKLVIYVHNLAYEWQFMRRFFNWKKVFLLKPKQPLYAETEDGFIFRCSYKLSNMSLEKFCENSAGVRFYKLSDDAMCKHGYDPFDYSKIRTDVTPLTDNELAYMYNDVRGLCECLSDRLREDNIKSIPLTSTGYVRRDMRRHLNANTDYAKKYRREFRTNALDVNLYSVCRKAFRGGDAHANYLWSNQVVKNVKSKDMTSAYPFVMMTENFPSSKWYPTTMDKMARINRKHTTIVWISLLKLTDVEVGYGENPYISLSKCVSVKEPTLDNGRIHACKELAIYVTNLDWEIIKWCYNYSHAYFANTLMSRSKPMPEFIKAGLMDYYRPKTALKNVEGSEYEYSKSKNSLNAGYGMAVTDIAKDEYLYSELGEYIIDEKSDLESRLNAYYNSYNSFMQYQQGIFVPAYTRYNLNKMLHALSVDKVYWDTDSTKYVDFDDKYDKYFDAENKLMKSKAEKAGAWAYDREGKKVYMGLWDTEKTALQFKTLGSKKYIAMYEGGKVKSTISGVNKKVGSDYFKEHGINSFAIGTTLHNCGNLKATYNDDMPHLITRRDYLGNISTFLTASNVALTPCDYTIGITKDYANLLDI